MRILGPSQASVMELFSEISLKVLGFNNFYKNLHRLCLKRSYPVGIYLRKVNTNTKTRCENMFKVNNKDTRTTLLASFYCLYC